MSDPHEINTPSGVCTRLSRVTGLVSTVWNHLKKHTGVGIVCAVAYFDPYVLSLSFCGKAMSFDNSLGEIGVLTCKLDPSLDIGSYLLFFSPVYLRFFCR